MKGVYDRVLRGCFWFDVEGDIRPTNRMYSDTEAHRGVGFRIVGVFE